ncbi:MAG: hypothetical protein RBT86_02805 [Azospira sp.]|jgi:hypothetical protein|nr:hypothetical protein [Azospira sp.]
MKRVLVILLTALLPLLQTGWAAHAMPGVPCGTGSGHAHHGAHGHSGHDTQHAADHQAGAAQADACHDPASHEADSGCGSCHASCCTLASTQSSPPPPAPGADTPGAAVAADHPSSVHQRPERPKWAGLA